MREKREIVNACLRKVHKVCSEELCSLIITKTSQTLPVVGYFYNVTPAVAEFYALSLFSIGFLLTCSAVL